MGDCDGGVGRPPAIAGDVMVATSHPMATRAGLRVMERGGNAADAVIAAAAVLSVGEPMSTGIGGDAFGIVWRDGEAVGLDAAGSAPARLYGELTVIPETGPRSVTVPGAVAGWAALAERFGSVGLDRCLSDAIDAAETGVALTVRASAEWAAERPPPEFYAGKPQVGMRVALPALGATLRRLAEEGPSAVYAGEIARGIASVSWLTEED